jgi:regulator of cell morphogenesis and NO signaling
MRLLIVLKMNTEVESVTFFDPEKTVSAIVCGDYRTADVFKKWGINYCCGGNATLDEVCGLRHIDKAAIENELEKAVLTVKLPQNISFKNWSLDFMVDYIINLHHAYLKKALPDIEQSLFSFVSGHKKKFPELEKVQAVFLSLAKHLAEHMEKEEQTIFPYIKQVSNAYLRKETYGGLLVRTLGKPLNSADAAHTLSAILLKNLRQATSNYHFPSNACTNYQVIYHKLKAFDDDLVQHHFLENEILFPGVLQMEKTLLEV